MADKFEKDREKLEDIIYYSKQVKGTLDRFGNNKTAFYDDYVFQNALAMPLQTICNYVKDLSDELKSKHPRMPWDKIAGMRTYFAHVYKNMDKEAIWNTAKNDVPYFTKQCQSIIRDIQPPAPQGWER